MNEPPGIDSSPPSGTPGGAWGSMPAPAHWREALSGLLGSRLALMQLEGKAAALDGVKRLACCIAAALCALFAYLFLWLGAVGLIVAVSSWSWYWVVLAAGGLHLLAALLFLFSAKRPGSGYFVFTRAEFLKDREWLKNLQDPRKSND